MHWIFIDRLLQVKPWFFALQVSIRSWAIIRLLISSVSNQFFFSLTDQSLAYQAQLRHNRSHRLVLISRLHNFWARSWKSLWGNEFVASDHLVHKYSQKQTLCCVEVLCLKHTVLNTDNFFNGHIDHQLKKDRYTMAVIRAMTFNNFATPFSFPEFTSLGGWVYF